MGLACSAVINVAISEGGMDDSTQIVAHATTLVRTVEVLFEATPSTSKPFPSGGSPRDTSENA